jgi:hypothetical protein
VPVRGGGGAIGGRSVDAAGNGAQNGQPSQNQIGQIWPAGGSVSVSAASAPIDIIESDDIVFAQIITALDLNQH